MSYIATTRCGKKDRHLHRGSKECRIAARRKLHAFHVFLFAGVIAQGLMHYLSACHTEAVWRAQYSWLRTIRAAVSSSELVVKTTLHNALPEFLLDGRETSALVRFITEKQGPDTAVDWAIPA